LTLTAGKSRGVSLEQRTDFQDFDRLLEAAPRLLIGAHAEADVAIDVEVRKEKSILRHIADTPKLRRKPDEAARVEQDLAIEDDPARCAPPQPGNALEKGGLARAGGAEDGDGLFVEASPNLERESRERKLEVEIDHALAARSRRLWIHSVVQTTPKAMRTVRATRRSAAESWPICVR
jgi:hypothetical protein